MTCQPKLAAGTFFQEVDDNGTLHHYWILAVAKPPQKDAQSSRSMPRPLQLEGNLATVAATAAHKQRITWDISGILVTDGMPAIG